MNEFKVDNKAWTLIRDIDSIEKVKIIEVLEFDCVVMYTGCEWILPVEYLHKTKSESVEYWGETIG